MTQLMILDFEINANHDRTPTKTETATLYGNKSGESGAELAEAFREVVKQVKDGIAGDIKSGKIAPR